MNHIELNEAISGFGELTVPYFILFRKRIILSLSVPPELRIHGEYWATATLMLQKDISLSLALV